jgi:hypothetical protein
MKENRSEDKLLKVTYPCGRKLYSNEAIGDSEISIKK